MNQSIKIKIKRPQTISPKNVISMASEMQGQLSSKSLSTSNQKTKKKKTEL
jgi:hypothetical protein